MNYCPGVCGALCGVTGIYGTWLVTLLTPKREVSIVKESEVSIKRTAITTVAFFTNAIPDGALKS
jgi:hypothetical protein